MTERKEIKVLTPEEQAIYDEAYHKGKVYGLNMGLYHGCVLTLLIIMLLIELL